MTTLTLTGILVEYDDNDNVTSVTTATFTGQFPGSDSVINYTLLPGSDPDDLPLVDIGGTVPLSVTVNGFDVANSDDTEALLGFIQTSAGTHVLLDFYNPILGVDAIFQIGGDPLTLPTTVAGFNALDNSITNIGVASGTYAPGVDIPITSLGGEISGSDVNVIEGTDGDDFLIGTAGDDLIVTGNSTPNGDQVEGSSGNDTIDMSGNDGQNGFLVLRYGGLDAPISVNIDGGANTGSIDKGANGTDTLIGVEQPLFAGWTNGGLDIRGTDFNDNFILSPEGQQWMSVRAGDGADSFTINGTGLVRLDFRNGNGIDVNLATGVIADDGFGNVETIGGTGNVWEVFGSVDDDVFTGSAADESYRYEGGNNTLDGGDGFDRLRYDVGQVQRIEADLAAGQVDVFTTGGTFTDTVSSIESLRGSGGNDLMIANDNGIRLDGRGGDDTLVGGLGNDRFLGGSGNNTFVFRGGFDSFADFNPSTDTLFIDIPGLTQADVDAAMADVLFFEGQYFVTFGEAQNITFDGLTPEQIQSIPAQLGNGGVGGPSVIEGTDGDDFLQGTAGDDLIVTGNATLSGDIVVGSAGNDTIDMSGNDGVNGFVTINYSALAGGIDVTIDGAANTGSVDKGADGTDTLLGVEQPLFAGNVNGGLGIFGTSGDDTFDLAPDAGQWMQVRGRDGVDSYIINGDGLVRLDFRDGNGIDVNLATGVIADDGFGNAETISGTGSVWEVFGSSGDDSFTGSSANESYRYTGGNNTLDGGDGFDRLRYDVGQVTSINADLASGTVNGTLIGGGTFTDTISGFEFVRGSAGDDTIAGDTNDNRLEGRGGSDTFIHVGGNDTIGDFTIGEDVLDLRRSSLSAAEVAAALAGAQDTGQGAQVSFAGGSSIIFNGLSAQDVATIQPLANIPGEVIDGTGAAEVLTGTDGPDTINGGAGSDTIDGGAGDDVIDAGQGFDLVFGGDGDDLIFGRAGFDTLEGGAGNDTLYGNAGSDVLDGGDGDDELHGGQGADLLIGGAGNDLLFGGAGFDTLEGGAGNDTLEGNFGRDLLQGGDGNDLLLGGQGADTLEGGAGNDTLRGGSGHDLLLGGDGDDRLEGNAGADTLDGGAGDDVLRGGIGVDTFVFRAGYGNDRIVDFQRGIDTVEIDSALLGGGTPDPLDLIPFAGRTDDGFVILDFGNGDTLTFTGITRTGMILDDVSFI